MTLRTVYHPMLLLITTAMTAMLTNVGAKDITVGNPGAGISVLTMEAVADVIGSPWDEDPPLFIQSEVPVQILRYSDYPEFFLEGGQPMYSHQVYVIVKSDCGDDATLIPDIEYSTANRTIEWDQSEYTSMIEITFPDAADDAIDMDTFLEPSVFNATWDYGSFWCFAQQATESPTSVPKRTRAPTSTQGNTTDGITSPPGSQNSPESTGVGSDVELTDPTQPGSGNPVSSTSPEGSAGTSTKTLIGIMITLLSSVCLMVGLGGANDHRSGKHSFMITLVVVMIAILMATSTTLTSAELPAMDGKHGGVTTPSAAGEQQIPRKLQQCAVTVEILIDGCRRVQSGSSLPDLEVVAPAVRVMDGEIQDLVSWTNATDECVTDYTANLAFNETLEGDDVAVGRQKPDPVTSVGSFAPGLLQYGACFRAVEGRPYIDSKGQHVHAKAANNDDAAWSLSKHGNAIEERDDVLGQQWLDRAIGEHASVPAFAAFTIALMSNNAPPELVQDALSAAQDEVRHAKTSFEVASLLLGKSMEPGPLPPSTLTFSQDMKSLALAAAKEGCVDETLSALVAGLEVEFVIDQNPNISEGTKVELKNKMRTIALEETKHSGLAWRTIKWACSIDRDACEAVRKEVFSHDYFESSFANRFAHLDSTIAAVAKQVWDEIHTTLTPLALAGQENSQQNLIGAVDFPSIPCFDEFASVQSNSVLEEMGQHIKAHFACAL